MIKQKIAKALCFTGLAVLWWVYLVNHYYTVLSSWVELKMWRTQPLMYASIEWWLLFSLLVCTYLVVKAVEALFSDT